MRALAHAFPALMLAVVCAGVAYAEPTFTCPGTGAVVDVVQRCGAIIHFEDDDKAPDPRIARHLQLAQGDYARSIAVVVAISEYANRDFDLPAARRDAERLKRFLIDDQKFDEVIVLENEAATIEAMRYFLRTYALSRSVYYRGKVRLLFAYSGHGVPVTAIGDVSAAGRERPSVGLALADASSDRDLQHIYGLNELRALFEDLSKNVFHFLALINACYGGDVFGLVASGGSLNDMASRGAWGITAGPADNTVISIDPNQGSLFFDKVITGVESGDADIEARKVTLKMATSPKVLDGIVRLGPLDSYISTEIEKVVEDASASAASLRGNAHHWSGAIAPSGGRSEGAFFFLQHAPAASPPPTQSGPRILSTFVSALRSTTAFAPSLNQIAAPKRTADDGFAALRAIPGEQRGINVSSHNRQIDWQTVAAGDMAFAYIKATQASAFVDRSFAANWAGAAAAKLPRGAYHYFSFCALPEEQLSLMRRTVPVDTQALPFALDAELYAGQGGSTLGSLAREAACAAALGADGIRRNIGSMLRGMKSLYGKPPILYANDYLLDEVLGADFTKDVTLWRTKPNLRKAPPPPWSLWQFTAGETVQGIVGPVDVNILSERINAKRFAAAAK